MSKYLQIFLSILILTVSLQSWTKANDINEFEIEGISVGDSVLKHKDLDYVKKILKDSNTFYYKDNAFAVIGLNISSDIFDQISATMKLMIINLKFMQLKDYFFQMILKIVKLK